MAAYELNSASIFVNWMSTNNSTAPNNEYSINKLLLGTQAASDDNADHVLICEVKVPRNGDIEDVALFETSEYFTNPPEYSSAANGPQFDVKAKLNHPGDVNCAKQMPGKQFVIATKSVSGEVLVFDYSKHESFPTNNECKPQMRLIGQDLEGYALEWSPHKSGHILVGSRDVNISLWDIEGVPFSGSSVSPISTFEGHTSEVCDVSWHSYFKELFFSCGHDGTVRLWDTRNEKNPCKTIKKSDQVLNTTCANPLNPFLFAVSGEDKIVSVLDLRNTKDDLYTLHGHTDEVYRVLWCPTNVGVLASCSADRRVILWNLSRYDTNAPESKSSMMFVHAGHTAPVLDFSWNDEGEDWVIASVSDDGILQIWKMSDECLEDMIADDGVKADENAVPQNM